MNKIYFYNYVGKSTYAAMVRRLSLQMFDCGKVMFPGPELSRVVEALCPTVKDVVVKPLGVNYSRAGESCSLFVSYVGSSGLVRLQANRGGKTMTLDVTPYNLDQVLGESLVHLGLIEYDEKYTGAEATDCTQEDSDLAI